jgi:hypothetical protein
MSYYKVLEIQLSKPEARKPNRRPVWDSRIVELLISPKTTGNHKNIPSFLYKEAIKRSLEFPARLSKPGTISINTRE